MGKRKSPKSGVTECGAPTPTRLNGGTSKRLSLSSDCDRHTETAAKQMSMAEATAEPKLPVTIVTGFLGSGKTTLLNHILTSTEHKRRIAGIENEFGEVSVDDGILTTKAQEEIVTLDNGCVCCTVRGDLVKTLKDLLQRRENFDYIIVETTGLADPTPVAITFHFNEEIKTKTTMDAIVTVVDAKHVLQHLG